MNANKTLTAIGLMSGTSLDGIDAAVLKTDGHSIKAFGPVLSVPYDPALREDLRALLGRDPRGEPDADATIRAMTMAHASVVQSLLAREGLSASSIDVIGFHGQTTFHAPGERLTVQVGDGGLLADTLGIPVIDDFRTRDVLAGGEGAPLAPLYHVALAASLNKPLCVLNIGGVANVTWIGEQDGDVLAFDTGPGNALIDDWVKIHTGNTRDENGTLAQRGRVNQASLAAMLDHPYFAKSAPKSLDRNDFSGVSVQGCTLEDGAATLTAFTAHAVARARDHLRSAPDTWLVCGGGRHNPTLMDALRSALGVDVQPVEAVGWQGDDLEAQAFAFLAVRALKSLPLSLPTTTGVPTPMSGGTLHAV